MSVVSIYRILNFAGIFATIGSFVIAVTQLVPDRRGDSNGSPVPQTQVCDTTLYEPAAEQLRAKPKPADRGRILTLGADSRFAYYYDYATGEIYCVARQGPIGPLVEGSHANAPDRTRQNGILICVLVIVSAAVGMKIIQSIRASRKREKG